jgi:hypothetical protein
MATKQKVIRRKEVRKERLVTIRFTDEDYAYYENRAIEEHIRLAELLREAIRKGIAKRKKV